jgi:non-ribosomal peptide synthetase component F
MSTLVQGAWALLLSRYSGEDDVVYGSIVSGRSAPLCRASKRWWVCSSTPSLSGCASRTSLVVTTWLKGLQQQQAELREHEHAPLFEVQALSEIPREHRLFESLLVFENYPVAESIRKPGAARELSVGEGKATIWTNYPLSVVAAFRGSLTVRIDYDRSRFDDATIERMLTHLQTLLEGIAPRAVRARLSSLPLISEREEAARGRVERHRRRLSHRDALIHDLFAEQADQGPEAIAVSMERGSCPIARWPSRPIASSHRLHGAGRRPRHPGRRLPRAQPRAGGGLARRARSRRRLRPSRPIVSQRAPRVHDRRRGVAAVLLTHERVVGHPPAQRPFAGARLDTIDLAAESASRPESAATPENLCYVIYTSGSTGKPKGAMLEHRGVVNYLRWAMEAYRVGEGRGAPVHSSVAFDLTVTSLFAPLLAGAR